MSIFNVGTGREPAEIGVAEYQKPDYQQFDKLASVNMQMKQAELEKAQKKTKEWGDILNTDFSTKYAVEQSQYVQKNIQSIKDDLMKEISKNPDLLNDPATIMQVKARLNQVKGYVKVLDEQAENIIKQKSEFEKDTKGIAYDKQYGKEYFEAQDNPIEFYKNNPDSEVGKKLGVIINSPEIQAITDTDQKRFAIRAAMQATPMKRGTIARNTDPTMPKLGHDDVFYESQNGSNKGFDVVSRPKIITSLMGHAKGMSDKDSNITYEDAWKDKLIHQYGDENTALEQIKGKYIIDYDNMQKQYGTNAKIEGLKDLPSPDKITPEELVRYSYADNYASRYTDRKEHNTTPKNIVNITNGGNTPKTSGSISAINKVSVPKVGGGYSEINIPETVIVPRKDDTEIRLDITYGMGADGSLFGVESSGSTANVQAKMGDSKLLVVPVYEGKTWKNPKTGIKHRVPLSPEDQEDMINNPSAWKGKAKFVTIITHRGETTQGGVKKVDNSFGYAKDNGTAFQAILKEAREQKYNGVIPTQVEYGVEDGLKIYNSLNAPKPF
jgi:hypothetical protein